jgi:hypothetical protein
MIDEETGMRLEFFSLFMCVAHPVVMALRVPGVTLLMSIEDEENQ